MVKGHMQDGKFHPHTDYKKGIRKSRDQKVKTQGIKVERMKRDIPEGLSGFENISMIKDKDVREDIFQTLRKFRSLFAKNRMENGMIWSFLEECVNGQILISLDKKPDHYVNTLSDFYIDDRVGFRGIKKIEELKEELTERMRPIVKYDKARFLVSDIVRADPATGNVILKEAIEKKPDIKFKIKEMSRGLDPHYIDYQIVDVDVRQTRNNWIYAGNDDLAQGNLI